MNILSKIFFANNENIEKKSVFWNMTASLLNAVTSAILLLVVTRFLGIVEGGIFSIASTIAYQMLSIGQFSMRSYQATDVKEMNSFSDYLLGRCFTCIIMIVVSVVYIFLKQYDMNKSFIVFGFILFKGIDAIEDVFHGRFQQLGRLDVAGKAQTIRYFLSILFFSLMVVITKSLVFACYASFVFSFIIFLIMNLYILFQFGGINLKYDWINIMHLLLNCFPLFLSGYLYLYICNSPKYAIDNVLTSEMQTIFGILFMPVFSINLLSTLIYRPMLTPLATKLLNNQIAGFFNDLKKQILTILGLTISILIFVYFFGIPFLSFFYQIDLSAYKDSLMILMIGGGMNALVGYLLCIITILRKQKYVLICYGLVTILAFIISDSIVFNFNIEGAAVLYLVLMSALAIQLLVVGIKTIYTYYKYHSLDS